MQSAGSAAASKQPKLSHRAFWARCSLALFASLDQARTAAGAGLALDPGFTIRRFRDGAQSDNPTFLAKRERVYQGLRMAGVPEG